MTGPLPDPLPSVARLQYTSRNPSAALRDRIALFSLFEVHPGATPKTPHCVPPDGCVSLVVREADTGTAVVLGPRTTPLVSSLIPGTRYWSAKLWPGVAPALEGLHPEHLANVLAPLAQLHPDLAHELEGCVRPGVDLEAVRVGFERALATRLAAGAERIDGLVRRVVRTIGEAEGRIPITDLAARVQMSPRQLQRRFRSAVGLTPKEFARIRRTQTAIERAFHSDEPLADVALELGFADQAHMTREFRALLGQAPTYVRDWLRRIDHDIPDA